jgi:two-component system, NtrC family, nitrogen regulation sensor histidine kinase NtrY
VINLLRNAVDAALPTQGVVRLSLASAQELAVIEIEDEGPGLAATDNVFVPFFTTKPEGCGIGLPLARQIAEAHGGSLTLENRKRKSGCVATLRLPLEAKAPTVDTPIAGSRAGG